jgi:hypothetical protein
MTREDLAALRRAAQLLEHPGLAARLANMLGRPIELIGGAPLSVSPLERVPGVSRASAKPVRLPIVGSLSLPDSRLPCGNTHKPRSFERDLF